MKHQFPFVLITSLALALAAAAWMSPSQALADCGTCGVAGAHEHVDGAKKAAAAAKQGLPAAPGFTLTDTNGIEHSLSDFVGKYVVLEWTNPDCPFVQKFYKSGKMQELQKHYTNKGIVWLTIAGSTTGKQGYYTAEQWNERAAAEGFNATAVLIDDSGSTGRAYSAKTTPHMYIINPDGKLIYQGAIDNNPSADPADIESANNYVTQVLDAALSVKTQPYGCSVKY